MDDKMADLNLSNSTAMKPTIRSIARDLDLSVMTVVRTLNGNHMVSPETKRKVLARVKELGFDYGSRSRTVKGQRSRRVAIYCSDVKFHGDALFNFFMRLHYLCVKQFKAVELEAFLVEPERLDIPTPEGLAEFGALVILGPFLPGVDVLNKWMELHPELRVISVLGEPLPVPSITANDYGGGAMAARELYAKGHRHAAVFCVMTEQGFQKRFTGFCGEFLRLDEHNVVERLVFPFSASREEQLPGMEAALDRFFADHASRALPTAFFVPNGYATWILAEYLKRKNRRIPEDFSILGYDDLDVLAKFDPPVSRITFDLKALASGAAAMLLCDKRVPMDSRSFLCVENFLIPGLSVGSVPR